MVGIIVAAVVALLAWPDLQPAPESARLAPSSKEPSIAVLPFDNMSGNPEQEYFADGITEDIITDLSKISGLLVISRHSTFTYKARVISAQQVSRELGARYILEGSVRRVKNVIRINAQLIDAESGTDLWAERFDSNLTDIFSVQDRVTERIVSALALQLSKVEQDRVKRRDTESVAAHEAFQRGWQHFQRSTPSELGMALSEFNQAIELDADYAKAYAAIGHTYWKSWAWGWEESVGATWDSAPRLARKFLSKAMENPTAIAHQLAADMAIYERALDKAIGEALIAIEMDPNDPSNHIVMAEALIYAGRPDDARQYVEKAVRLDPLNPAYTSFVLGLINFGMNDYEQSIPLFESALEANPQDFAPAAPLAAAYAHLNRNQEMHSAFQKYLAGWPEANIAEFRTYWPYKDPADDERLLDGLRKAGMPES